MINYLRLIAILLVVWSCSSSTDELANYFDSTEIEELKQLTQFVVGELAADCEGNQTDCLQFYFDQLRNSGYDFDLTVISKLEQSKLLSSLSESTSKDIWSTCKGSRPTENGRVDLEAICPNMNGKFAYFLIDYCAKTDRLTSSADAFEQAGFYSPAMNAQLIKNPDSFNFKSEAELLLISVHLLSLNSEDMIVESVPN